MNDYCGLKILIPFYTFIEGKFEFNDVIVKYTFDPLEMFYDKKVEKWLYKPVTLPLEIKNLMKEMKGKDTQLCKLRNCKVKDGRLILEIKPTSWLTYQATNLSLDREVCLSNGSRISIRKKYRINVKDLNDFLANPIGVSAMLISEPDNTTFLVKRSKILDQYPGLYGVFAAGFMERERDNLAGVPNPFKTIQREIKEEVGIDVELNDFKIFCIGRATDDLHVEIFGEVRVNYKTKEIEEVAKKIKRKEYESLDVVDFSPDGLLKYLVKRIEDVPRGIKSGREVWIPRMTPEWVPAHFMCVLRSLIEEYGEEKVLKKLKNI